MKPGSRLPQAASNGAAAGVGVSARRDPIFDVRDLEVAYRGGVKAVRGVSFTLAEGGSLGIVGESGSGKSTLVKALMLLLRPSGGRYLYRGADALAMGAAARRAFRRDVQMVFQDAVGSLNPRMTVRQTLEEVVRRAGGARDRSATGRRIAELLELTGLSSAVLDQYPGELSGGQCQRASFARALALDPKVIVADEPVSALDVSVQARILNLLRDLQRRLGLAVVLISHDLAVVRNVCDDVCVMHDGVFVERGGAVEVFDHPRDAYTRRLVEAVPDVARELARRSAIKR